MKTLCFVVLLISAAIAQQANIKTTDDVAELKLSLSTQAINKLVSFIGDMIDNISQGAPVKIPLDVDVKGKWNLYSIKLNNMILANHTVNWNKDAISINALGSNNTFQNFVLTLSDLTFLTTVTLTPSADPNTIGFFAKLSDTSLKLDALKVHLEDQKIYNAIIQPFVYILKLLLNPIVKIAVLPINTAIHNLCNKPLAPEIKIGQSTYQFNINFPQGITQKQSDLRIPVNIKSITNLNSTDVAPVSQEVELPDYYFANHTNRYDLEILLGTGITNQLIWTVADSKLLTFTVNQNSAIMKNIPLALNVQGLQLLLPGLYNEYVIRRKMPPTTGVYIQAYVPQQTPDFRLVGGRLTGTLNASAKFLVELDQDEYPVADISKCQCDLGADVSLTIYFAADVYTPGKFKIGADVSNLQIVSSSKTAGPIDFDGDKFATSATALIYNLVGIINQQLSKGMDIPYVSQASFLEDITLIFEQGYIFVDVGIDPNN